MAVINDWKNTMLVSPAKVKEYAVLNLNCNDTDLGNSIRIAQNIFLKDNINRDLIEHLQQLVYNKIKGEEDNIDTPANEPYKVLLQDFITPALVYRAAVEAVTIMTLKIRSAGLVKNNDTNVETTDQGEVAYMHQYYTSFYNDALNRLSDFLCENKGFFTEIPSDFCTCSQKPLFARTNLWLG